MGALELDPRTIMFVTAFMGPVMAMVLLSMRRNYPATFRGLGWWVQGTWWIFGGVILVASRNWIDPLLSTTLGNALIVIGTFQWLMGSEKFLKIRSNQQNWLLFLATTILLSTFFQTVYPSFEMRVVVICSAMVVLLGAHALRLLRQNRYPYATRFLSVALFAGMLSWLARMVGSLMGQLSTDLFAPSVFNALLNSAQSVATLLILVGFVLLASERVREEFELLATKDSLTGALIRRAWNGAALAELERSRRHGRALSLVAMDLDGFKLINDSLGHAAGDQVLVHFVAAVDRHLRKQDQLGRMGGEEFVLLLPETTLDEATLVAERIRAATQAIQEPCAFTVSIGVAQLFSGETTLETLLERADAAMYRAKARGRNRVELETSPDTPLDLSVSQGPVKSILRRS